MLYLNYLPQYVNWNFWYLCKFYKTFYSSKSSFCPKTKVANLSLAISWLRYLKQKSLYFFGPKILIYHANLFYLSWNFLKDEICCTLCTAHSYKLSLFFQKTVFVIYVSLRLSAYYVWHLYLKGIKNWRQFFFTIFLKLILLSTS